MAESSVRRAEPLLLFVGVFPVVALATWFTLAGARLGWVPTVAVHATFGAVAAWLGWGERFRWVRVIALVGAFGAFGAWQAHVATPTIGRVRAVVRAVERPGWRFTGETSGGNALCFDECPTVSRSYTSRRSESEVVDDLRRTDPRFRRGGWADLRRTTGDVDVVVRVEPRAGGGTTIDVIGDA